MARKKRIRWTWDPVKGLLAWEYVRNGMVLASSNGMRPVGESLADLVDWASDLDDEGQEAEAHRVMEEWVAMAWSLRHEVNPTVRQAIEEACQEWWNAEAEENEDSA
ncbi:MAG: hypothetical protein WHS46_03990 [Desulfosoma sp.]